MTSLIVWVIAIAIPPSLTITMSISSLNLTSSLSSSIFSSQILFGQRKDRYVWCLECIFIFVCFIFSSKGQDSLHYDTQRCLIQTFLMLGYNICWLSTSVINWRILGACVSYAWTQQIWSRSCLLNWLSQNRIYPHPSLSLSPRFLFFNLSRSFSSSLFLSPLFLF